MSSKQRITTPQRQKAILFDFGVSCNWCRFQSDIGAITRGSNGGNMTFSPLIYYEEANLPKDTELPGTALEMHF